MYVCMYSMYVVSSAGKLFKHFSNFIAINAYIHTSIHTHACI